MMALGAERWLDQLVLRATVADVAIADIAENFVAPAGLDDLAILSINVGITNVGTVPATATVARGAKAVILSQDGSSIVDLVSVEEFKATGGVAAAFTRFDAHLDPDALTLWRRGELIQVSAPEMDLGATGDLVVLVKAVRVRPIEEAEQPIQLVR